MRAARSAALAVLELTGVLVVAAGLAAAVTKLDDAIHLLARLAP
jgi:hypothetical protein